MHNSQDQRDLAAVPLDTIGAEPLIGSGFETEEPEPSFSVAELETEE
jgi:hypothetical protein